MKPTCCRHLRTKKMFIEALVREAAAVKEGEHASPTYYWCNLTQTQTGVDDGPVDPTVCDPSRSCFEE